jgi:hypothetical protein
LIQERSAAAFQGTPFLAANSPLAILQFGLNHYNFFLLAFAGRLVFNIERVSIFVETQVDTRGHLA